MTHRPPQEPASEERRGERPTAGRSIGDAAMMTAPYASLLDARRTRYLLYCLHLYANPLRLPDIAHQVTIWDQPETAEVDLEDRLETYMSLYHDHLPELEDADVVTYEQASDMVALGPAADRIEPALERRLGTDLDDLLQAENP